MLLFTGSPIIMIYQDYVILRSMLGPFFESGTLFATGLQRSSPGSLNPEPYIGALNSKPHIGTLNPRPHLGILITPWTISSLWRWLGLLGTQASVGLSPVPVLSMKCPC